MNLRTIFLVGAGIGLVGSHAARATSDPSPDLGNAQDSTGSLSHEQAARAGGPVQKPKPGVSETVLYSFQENGLDGLNPQSSLVQGSDGNFYGTNLNTAYEISINAATGAVTETVLHAFQDNGRDGYNPLAALVQGADGAFYGRPVRGAPIALRVRGSFLAELSFGSQSNSPAARWWRRFYTIFARGRAVESIPIRGSSWTAMAASTARPARAEPVLVPQVAERHFNSR